MSVQINVNAGFTSLVPLFDADYGCVSHYILLLLRFPRPAFWAGPGYMTTFSYQRLVF